MLNPVKGYYFKPYILRLIHDNGHQIIRALCFNFLEENRRISSSTAANCLNIILDACLSRDFINSIDANNQDHIFFKLQEIIIRSKNHDICARLSELKIAKPLLNVHKIKDVMIEAVNLHDANYFSVKSFVLFLRKNYNEEINHDMVNAAVSMRTGKIKTDLCSEIASNYQKIDLSQALFDVLQDTIIKSKSSSAIFRLNVLKPASYQLILEALIEIGNPQYCYSLAKNNSNPEDVIRLHQAVYDSGNASYSAILDNIYGQGNFKSVKSCLPKTAKI